MYLVSYNGKILNSLSYSFNFCVKSANISYETQFITKKHVLFVRTLINK